jgi:phage baseplate assembly protein W
MPSFTIPSSATPLGVEIDTVTVDIFGRDVLWKANNTVVTASGDYALVEGLEALKQAIWIRLIVSPGEYAGRPDFGVGLPQYVKKRTTPALLDEIRQRILDQLSKDDRIERVLDAQCERYDLSGQTGIRVVVKVEAVGREQSFAYQFFQE